MKRVLIICFSNNHGGMEINSMDFAKLLAKSHSVSFVCRSGGFLSQQKNEIEASGVHYYEIGFKNNFSFKCIFELRKILIKENVKNIIFFGASEMKSIFFSALKLKINISVFHGIAKQHNKNDPWHKLVFSSVSYHIAVSEWIRQNVLKIIPGATPNNVKVIYLPRDDRYESSKPRPQKQYFVHVSRIIKNKGQLESIEVIRKLVSKGYDPQLTIIGGVENKDYYQLLQKTVASSPELSERVRFVGFTREVHKYLSQNTYFIFPTEGEGLPNVVIEAFLAKTIPITFDNTVFPEMLKMGFQFLQATTGNFDSLMNAVEKTINLTESEYQKIIENNYQLSIKLFNSKSVLEQYNRILI